MISFIDLRKAFVQIIFLKFYLKFYFCLKTVFSTKNPQRVFPLNIQVDPEAKSDDLFPQVETNRLFTKH